MRKINESIRRPLGAFTITRIVRETHLLESSSAGHSIGGYIDEALARAAAEGASIQDIALHFEPEQWEEIATSIYGGYVEDAQ